MNSKKTFNDSKTNLNKPENLNLNQSNSFDNIFHNHNLICFQKCSNWFVILSLISNKNKKLISNSYFGKIEEKDIYQNHEISNLYFQNDLSDYFPIDIKENQRLVLNNQKKIPLLISFDFNQTSNNKNNNTFISNVNSDFTSSLFEIDLNASIHSTKKIFNNNINFRIKGFDIYKAIGEKISNLNINDINNIKGDYFSLETFVFNNIQCSFGLSFIVSKINLINYINGGGKYSFLNLNITIEKLYFKYYLSLNVFTNYNLKNTIPLQINQKNNLFCNFKVFLSNTTLHYKEQNPMLENIIKSIYKNSETGIECLFKTNYFSYVKINYFPILNNLYLNISKNNSTKKFKPENRNENTNYYNSLSYENNNTEKVIHSQKIYFKENFTEPFQKINYIDQINNLLKIYPELIEISLNEIQKDSYFSLIWVPFREKHETIKNFDLLPLIAFENYYKFKSSFNVINSINIFGIIEKNLSGINIDASKIFLNFDYFWFSNFNILGTSNFFLNYNSLIYQKLLYQSIYINKSLYLSLKNYIVNEFKE